MEKQYWAKRGNKVIGPCRTRDEAIETFRKQNPFKKAAYLAKAKQNQILTGYGAFDPIFDMQWHDAA